jgi:hypothetical protein
MSHVSKCDSCGTLDDVSNRVLMEGNDIDLHSSGLRITVDIPRNQSHSHLCRECVRRIISARFAELCGMLAPYQPARVAGFVQGGVTGSATVDEQPLSADERKALTILSRRLLKA